MRKTLVAVLVALVLLVSCVSEEEMESQIRVIPLPTQLPLAEQRYVQYRVRCEGTFGGMNTNQAEDWLEARWQEGYYLVETAATHTHVCFVMTKAL